MVTDSHIIEAAAELISASLGDLPVREEAQWRNLGEEDAKVLEDLIDELSWADLMVALRQAAARMPEPTVEDDVDAPPVGDVLETPEEPQP